LHEIIRPTTIIRSPRLDSRTGCSITLASETFQFTGSFKFRAAYNVAASVKQKMIITASSGNFGQALAYACSLLGKQCKVVMPDNSARVKVEAVKEFGGEVDLVKTTETSRSQRLAELAALHTDAYVASAYDDPLVIAGNASLGKEIASLPGGADAVVVPIGGGGLSAGIIDGLRQAQRQWPVYGCEPAMANDASRSLRAGKIIANESEPQTIADGARTLSIGNHNWKVLKEGLQDVIEVSEKSIEEAVRLLFFFANLKAEPTGAMSLAAVLTRADLFAGKKVVCVVSGGNIDPAAFIRIISAAKS
jgi:threonine dehydratase